MIYFKDMEFKIPMLNERIILSFNYINILNWTKKKKKGGNETGNLSDENIFKVF